jgi:aminopeptidase N
MHSRVKYFLKTSIILCLFTTAGVSACSQQFTKQDSLRGSNGLGRSWWNVKKYDLAITVDITNESITGNNAMTFEVTNPSGTKIMQIDLQKPMEIEKIIEPGAKFRQVPFKREGNVYWVDFSASSFEGAGKLYTISIQFKGKPRKAVNPPWDGGWVWTHDAQARPWISVACQGLGASVWYPCKDIQSDEPDDGASFSIKVPSDLVAVANGRLSSKKENADEKTTTYLWSVKNPINNYNIIPYIGKYVNFTDTYKGEKGDLDCSYWVLDYNLDKAKKHFGRDVPRMLKCFEDWFGPFPFYEDGYKLVEAPYLGMEHQSAVAYGNNYMNGYRGMDLSGSGWGEDWDYITVHESGHEWFGNNITTNDVADMWVHEGFTCYSETLFVECTHGKKAADEYTQGIRNNISNDVPIIGPYGVNKEGSSDMYTKGNNLIHTIRQVIDNDVLFRQILRGLNKDFYHKTINSSDVEKYMTDKSGKDLSKIFDQYLRQTKIPVLEWITGDHNGYRWTNCIPGFNMPVKLLNGKWIYPTTTWQYDKAGEILRGEKDFKVNSDFYILTKMYSKEGS